MRKNQKPNLINILPWTLVYILLILLAILCIIPFHHMIVNATQSNTVIMTSFTLRFGNALKRNFVALSSVMDIGRVMLNSLLLAGGTTFISLYFSSLTAYGFAKFRFRLRNKLFMSMLFTMMLPGQLGVIGFFQEMSRAGFMDTYLPMFLPPIANAGCVFFLHQYCQAYVPDSIIESGRIDGMHELDIFHRLVIPIMAPAIATQAIFLFVGGWNDFLNPLLFLSSPEKYPIVLAVQQLTGVLTQDYGATYLSLALSILPILVLFFIVSRFILDDLTLGSVKG